MIDFDVYDDDSIINRLNYERHEVRIGVNMIEIIKDLPITNANLPYNSLSWFQSGIIPLYHLWLVQVVRLKLDARLEKINQQ